MTAWISQNRASTSFSLVRVVKAKTQRTREQNDRRIVTTIVVLNNPVILVTVLLAIRGFLFSASVVEEEEEEEQSLWRAKKVRMMRKDRSTAEERSRCGQGDSRMNLSHWIGTGREDDGSMNPDDEQERPETHEEESHHIFSDSDQTPRKLHCVNMNGLVCFNY